MFRHHLSTRNLPDLFIRVNSFYNDKKQIFFWRHKYTGQKKRQQAISEGGKQMEHRRVFSRSGKWNPTSADYKAEKKLYFFSTTEEP